MIGSLERRKDTIQLAVESAFSHVGQIATIVAEAGRELTREVGDWATDMFEIREAARRAEAEARDAVDHRWSPDPLPPMGAGDGHELRRPLRRS